MNTISATLLRNAGRVQLLRSTRLQHRFQSTQPVWQTKEIYQGGLAKAAKVMKLASVASFVGASCAVPFFFAGESDVPSAARTILAVTTIGMTGSSTAIITWALRPYITSLKLVYKDHPQIDPHTPLLIETMTFLAQSKTRLVFPEQLAPATMPLTSWVVEPPSESLASKAQQILSQINSSQNKITIAQPGDQFYAHSQGQISAEMQQVLAATKGIQ
ncbi:hypothetical protein LPJ78_002782 [Coemansia sp. RSA 989]|nr:hypothetical protein LPJ78_002782 [Coemansia sp. RSA 989]